MWMVQKFLSEWKEIWALKNEYNLMAGTAWNPHFTAKGNFRARDSNLIEWLTIVQAYRLRPLKDQIQATLREPFAMITNIKQLVNPRIR